MEHVMETGPAVHARTPARVGNPADQAYQILRWGFVGLTAIIGLDKFFHLLADWDQYLAPAVERLLPVSTRTFMMGAGVAELMVAVLVAVKPRIGAYVVAAWLAGIAANLVVARGYYDIALRDAGLAVAAIALARLSARHDGAKK